MASIKLAATVEVDDEFLSDIIAVALEGGIGYWSQADQIVRESEYGVVLTMRPECNWRYRECVLYQSNDDESGYDEAHPLKLDRAAIVLGLSRMLDFGNDLKVAMRYRTTTLEAVVEKDAGNIDAELADIIVQVALLNDIVYG